MQDVQVSCSAVVTAKDMSEHPPSCACNTLTEWNHFTSSIKGVVFDYIRVSHSDDLTQMLSVENIQFIQYSGFEAAQQLQLYIKTETTWDDNKI